VPGHTPSAGQARFALAATRGGDDDRARQMGLSRTYASLLGITLLNPTTVIYFAALVVGSQTTATPDRFKQALFVLGAFAASASWQLLLAAGGALLGKALTGDRGKLLTALASSILITFLAVRLLGD